MSSYFIKIYCEIYENQDFEISNNILDVDNLEKLVSVIEKNMYFCEADLEDKEEIMCYLIHSTAKLMGAKEIKFSLIKKFEFLIKYIKDSVI